MSRSAEKEEDLSDLVLAAYSEQTLAEAQEVVVARAIEKGNAATLVSALAHVAAKGFRRTTEALVPLPAELFEKWRIYTGLKTAFYLAVAHAYRGDALLQASCDSNPRQRR